MTQINNSQSNIPNSDLLPKQVNTNPAEVEGGSSSTSSIFYSSFEDSANANGKIELSDNPTSVFMNNGKSIQQAQDASQDVIKKMASFDINAKYQEQMRSLFQEFSYDTSQTTEQSDNIVRQNLNEQIKTINNSVQDLYNQALETAKAEVEQEELDKILSLNPDPQPIQVSTKNVSPEGEVVETTRNFDKNTVTEKKYFEDDPNNYTEISTGKGFSSKTQYIDGQIYNKTVQNENGTHSAQYDGSGNTIVKVQNKETYETLAAQFNCSPDELRELNSNKKITSGVEIKIPGIVEPDDERLVGRKTTQQINYATQRISIPKKDQQKIGAALKQVGFVYSPDGYGKSTKGRIAGGNGQQYDLEIVGTAKGKNGNNVATYARTPDGKLLAQCNGSEYFVQVKDPKLYANASGETIPSSYGRLKVIGNLNDGPTAKAVDQFGNIYFIDSNNNVRPQKFDNNMLSAAQGLNQEGEQAASGVNELKDNLKNDSHQAIAEFIASSISAVGTVAGTEKTVNEFNSHMAALLDYAKQGDTVGFEKAFQSFFGQPYNASAVKNALSNPNDMNARVQAFGKKYANINMTVNAAANQQRDVGNIVSWVEETSSVVGGVALNRVLDGYNLYASVRDGASVYEIVKDKILNYGFEKATSGLSKFGDIMDDPLLIKFLENSSFEECKTLLKEQGVTNDIIDFVLDPGNGILAEHKKNIDIALFKPIRDRF